MSCRIDYPDISIGRYTLTFLFSFYKKFLEIDPAIKILIISGSIEEDYLVEYLVSGKIEFLQKPFLTKRLLEALKKMLQQKIKN